MTAYYDTDRIHYFASCRFLASGNTYWDFVLSPTCPWVYYVSKVSGHLSGSYGPLDTFLDQHMRGHRLVDYIPPLPDHYRQCQNPQVDITIPPYKGHAACCTQQHIKACS